MAQPSKIVNAKGRGFPERQLEKFLIVSPIRSFSLSHNPPLPLYSNYESARATASNFFVIQEIARGGTITTV